MAINQAPVLTTANANGIVKLDFEPFGANAPTVALQADGKIVVNGYAWTTSISTGYSELVRYNADGSLDSSFGVGGVVPYGRRVASPTTESGVAVQTDGKIVIGDDAAVARYNSDGSLDTSFATGGKVPEILLGLAGGYGIALEPDGKIVVGGEDASFGLTRYDSNGNLDASFGIGGKVTASFGASVTVQAHSFTSQPDGKLVVAGYADAGGNHDFALARYNTDGSLDASFGTGGRVTTDFASGRDDAFGVTLQADGKIVAVGFATDESFTRHFALVRYNADGSLDASFGTGGKVTTSLASIEDGAESVKVQSDGKIVVAGYSFVGPGARSDLALVRYNSDGSLDTSFGSGGKVLTDLGSNREEADSIVIQPDGKIVVVGTTGEFPGQDQALVRYNSDGSLDTSFGNGAALNGPAFFIEGRAPTVLNASATVHDAELDAAGSYAGASLTLARHGGANADDVFTASGNLSPLAPGSDLTLSGIAIGTVTQNTAGVLVLTFGANATEARVDEAMRDITYADMSDNPTAPVQIDWSFSDGNTGAQGSGGALAAAGSTTVFLTPVNDAPVNTMPDHMLNIPAGADYVIAGLSVSDPDSTLMDVTLGVDHGTLTVAAVDGVSVTPHGSNSVELSGSLAQVDAALGGVHYHSAAGFTGADTLTMTTQDDYFGPRGFDSDVVAINVEKSSFDFNDDGKSDIFYFNDNGSTWLSLIDGIIANGGGSGPALASGQHIASVVDFDGDIKADVLIGSDNGTVLLDKMNGAGVASSVILTTLSAGWHIEAAADFNGDGKGDILFSNDSGALWLSTTDGTAITGGGIPGALNPGWHIGAVADFDGDGKSDILYRNDNGQLWLNEMDGAAVKAGAPLTTLAAGWHIAASGDFDGDGRSDLLFRNDDGRVWLSEYDGFNTKGGGMAAGTGPDWHVAAAGDYNADGKSDILWQNDNGSLWISHMDGATVTDGGVPGHLDPGWHLAVQHFDLV